MAHAGPLPASRVVYPITQACGPWPRRTRPDGWDAEAARAWWEANASLLDTEPTDA